MTKKILFLSALDFKDKSIQVIRKTPEYYAKAGWQVDYIVARDTCPKGNYSYEQEINPNQINVIRTYWPVPNLRANLPKRLTILCNKLAGWWVIGKLAYLGLQQYKATEYDVIYGYELHGVLAMAIVRWFSTIPTTKWISRFQGTFLHGMFTEKQYARLLFNSDLIAAIWSDSDLLIMTNDGTQGDQAVKTIKRQKPYSFVFWVNGVDLFLPDQQRVSAIRQAHQITDEVVFLSVSRLVGWKRVDRNLQIVKALKDRGFSRFKYWIVGEGDAKLQLQALVEQLDLTKQVIFIGSISNAEVKNYLAAADFFLSMYDASNVGNPLLEAIRAHKMIITLNNGDTKDWITHGYNGLIYDINLNLFTAAAHDILSLIQTPEARQTMLTNLQNTEKEKLWTWDERMAAELYEVNILCKNSDLSNLYTVTTDD